MNIVVFGATGGTGRQVLELAAAAGHTVTAFARDPKAVTAAGARVVAGDVLDPDAVLRAVDGADAVVSALGIGYSRAATTVYSAGTAHIIKAMLATGATRFQCVSTTSMAPRAWTADPVQRALGALILHPMLRRPYADMALMEQSVLASALDWTLVRAARLTSGPSTGGYRVSAPGTRLRGGWSISRADLAHYLVRSLPDPTGHRAVVEIAY
jgi:putative NADH-flavin reductase